MSKSLALVHRAEKWLDRLSNLCIIVSAIGLAVLVATFGWLVWGRYVMNSTPTWVEQLALLLIVYIAFLGAVAGIHEQFHLGVTLFRDAFGDKVRRILMFIIDVILAGFGLAMLIAGIELFKFDWDTNLPMLNISEAWRTLAVVIGGGMIFFFAGVRSIFRIIYALNGEAYPDPDHTEEIS